MRLSICVPWHQNLMLIAGLAFYFGRLRTAFCSQAVCAWSVVFRDHENTDGNRHRRQKSVGQKPHHRLSIFVTVQSLPLVPLSSATNVTLSPELNEFSMAAGTL